MHWSSTNSCALAQENDDLLTAQMLADLPEFFPEAKPFVCDQANGIRSAETLARLKVHALRHAGSAVRNAEWHAALVARHPALVNDNAPTPANDDSPVSGPALVRDLVKKRRRGPRRKSRARSLKDARTARRYRGSLPSPKSTPAEAAPVTSATPSSSTSASPSTSTSPTTKKTLKETSKKTLTEKTAPKKSARRPRGIASWDDAGDFDRLVYVNAAVDRFGVPFAFTLNLDPRVVKAANQNSRGFLNHVRRRVIDKVETALDRNVEIWIAVETTSTGRPHLHGGMAISENEIPAATAALARAGGTWKSKSGDYQTDLRPQWEPDGWASYPLKRDCQTRRHLRDAAGLPPKAKVQIVSYTNGLRDMAKRLHAEDRRMINKR